MPISARGVTYVPCAKVAKFGLDVRHGGSVAGEPLAQDTKQLVQGGVLSYGHAERLPKDSGLPFVAARMLAWIALARKQKSRLVSPSP